MVTFSSQPSNARVYLNSKLMGNTPLCVKLQRSESYHVIIELDGYEPYVGQINRELSGWIFGNILFGGPIGFVIDAISGGMYRLTPKQMDAFLEEKGIIAMTNEDSFQVHFVKNVNPEWEQVGQLVRK